MKRIGFIILCFLAVWMVSAQSELKRDSVGINEKWRVQPSLSGTKIDSLRKAMPNNGSNFVPALEQYKIQQQQNQEEPMTLTFPTIDYFPRQLLQERTSVRMPFANDFSYSGYKILDNSSWLEGGTVHRTIPTFGAVQRTSLQYNRVVGQNLLLSGALDGTKMELHERQYGNLQAQMGVSWAINNRLSLGASGEYSVIRQDGGQGSMMGAYLPSEISGGLTSAMMPLANVQAGLSYQMTNWLNVSGGPYLNRMNLFQQSVNDYGLNGKMNLRLTDRLNVNLHGKYSLRGKQTLMNQNPLFPDNNYGGAVEYRISDSFGLGAGVDRFLNPYTGKWVTRPYVYPIFYNKDDKKGVSIQFFGK